MASSWIKPVTFYPSKVCFYQFNWFLFLPSDLRSPLRNQCIQYRWTEAVYDMTLSCRTNDSDVGVLETRCSTPYSNIVACTSAVINVFRLKRQEIVCAYFMQFGGRKNGLNTMAIKKWNGAFDVFCRCRRLSSTNKYAHAHSDIIYDFICVSQTQKDIVFTLGFGSVHFRRHDNDEWTPPTTIAGFKM